MYTENASCRLKGYAWFGL